MIEVRSIFRNGVVFICMVLTLYQGYICTMKYLSNPESIDMKHKSIETLPPLRYSICVKLKVTECQQISHGLFYVAADWYTGSYQYSYDDYDNCVFDFGEIPNYATSHKEFWEETLKRENIAPGDLIRSIGIWNNTSENWDIIFKWSQNIKGSTTFRMNIIPIDEANIYICHTLKLDLNKINTKIKIIPRTFAKEEKAYHNIHLEGQLMIPQSVTSLKRITEAKTEIQTYSNIEATEQISNKEEKCENNDAEYDSCIEYYRYTNPAKICALPFEKLKDTGNIRICKNYTEGITALTEYVKIPLECNLPCKTISVKFHDDHTPFMDLLSNQTLVNMLGSTGQYDPGHFLNLPNKITYNKFVHSYGFVAFVADFAGFSGMLIGASVFALVHSVMSSVIRTESIRTRALKYTDCGTILVSSAYLVYVLVNGLCTLYTAPTSTVTVFEQTKPDYTVTLCTQKFSFSFEGDQNVAEVDIVSNLDNPEFWLQWTNISSKISMITALTADNSVIDLLDPAFKSLIGEMSFPSSDKTIEFCHSFNLAAYENNINKIFMAAIADMSIYVHLPEQFLFAFRQKGSFVNAFSPLNVEMIAETISVSNMKLNYIFEKNIDLTQSDPKQSYDKCVVEASKTLATLHNPISKSINDQVDQRIGIANVLEDNICPDPRSSFNAEANFIVDTSKSQIKENYSTKIELIFPRLTKVHQTYRPYTMISLIAEFGGWTGILIGASLMDLLNIKKLSKKARQCLGIILKLFCSSCLLWNVGDGIYRITNNIMEAQIKTVPASRFALAISLCRIDQARFVHSILGSDMENVTSIKVKDEGQTWTDLEGSLQYDFSTILKPPTVHVCKEFKLPDGTRELKISHNVENANLHVYFHEPGAFYLQNYVKKYSRDLLFSRYNILNGIDFKVQDFESDPDFSCSMDQNYDDCVHEDLAKQLNHSLGCTFPFKRNQSGMAVCSTGQVDRVLSVLESVEVSGSRCPGPCSLVYIDIKKIQKKPGDERKGYDHQFILPRQVNLSRPEGVHTAWSILAEFGGWVGLFVGLCVIDLFDFLWDAVASTDWIPK